MPKPAGPLPRRQRELCARTARDHLARQEFPHNQEFPLNHSILPFVLLTYHYVPSTQHTDKKHKETGSRRCLGEASKSRAVEIAELYKNDACQFEPFRLGLGSSSSYGSLCIDYEGNCLAGTSPLDSSCLV